VKSKRERKGKERRATATNKCHLKGGKVHMAWYKTLPLKSIQSHLVSSNTISVEQKFQSLVHKPPVVHELHSYDLPNKWHYTKIMKKVKKTQTITTEMPRYL